MFLNNKYKLSVNTDGPSYIYKWMFYNSYRWFYCTINYVQVTRRVYSINVLIIRISTLYWIDKKYHVVLKIK